MPTVYRIVGPDGAGVFNGGWLAKAQRKLMDEVAAECFWDLEEPDPWRHPGPVDDPGLMDLWMRLYFEDRVSMGFGCKDMDQLIQWFDSEKYRQALKELGCVVHVYECEAEHYVCSPWQCIYKRDTAVLVDTLPIPTLS